MYSMRSGYDRAPGGGVGRPGYRCVQTDCRWALKINSSCILNMEFGLTFLRARSSGMRALYVSLSGRLFDPSPLLLGPKVFAFLPSLSLIAKILR